VRGKGYHLHITYRNICQPISRILIGKLLDPFLLIEGFKG